MKLINNLKNNTFSFGPFPKSSDPSIIECMGLAGFDFLVIDLEHGPNTIETAQNLVRAASLHEMTPIIQVSENNEYLISSVLDIGAQGVQVPQIEVKKMPLKLLKQRNLHLWVCVVFAGICVPQAFHQCIRVFILKNQTKSLWLFSKLEVRRASKIWMAFWRWMWEFSLTLAVP